MSHVCMSQKSIFSLQVNCTLNRLIFSHKKWLCINTSRDQHYCTWRSILCTIKSIKPAFQFPIFHVFSAAKIPVVKFSKEFLVPATISILEQFPFVQGCLRVVRICLPPLIYIRLIISSYLHDRWKILR